MELSDIPNDVLNHILYNYLIPNDIFACLLSCKSFHVMNDFQLNIIRNAHKGWIYCVKNGFLNACKWLLDMNYNLNYSYQKKCLEEGLDFEAWIPSKRVRMYGNLDIYYCGNSLLILACENNHPELVKWLILNVTDISYLNHALERVCELGHLVIAQFLYSLIRKLYAPIFVNPIFRRSCLANQKNICTWLLETDKDIDIYLYNEDLFLESFIYGNKDMVKFLWEESVQRGRPYHLTLELLSICCINGYHELAEWLLQLSISINQPIDIHSNNEEAFRNACRYGRTEMVKWLLQLDDNINIHANNEDAFVASCGSGNIEIIQLLLKLGEDLSTPIDIHAQQDLAFQSACNGGHLDIMKLLITLTSDSNTVIDIHADSEKAFGFCCSHGHLDGAQWLWNYSLKINSPINIRIDDDIIYRKSFDPYNIKVANWLYELSVSLGEPIDRNSLDPDLEAGYQTP